ncbi:MULTISPECIES: hypothetical protein [Sorangium]|uniref:Secreted protein n=1 Tax=Sorangium cellulosum TaxID=56 RepID=A0A4P2QZZ8_SORCE|nr:MULTISPECIES: hypothetical protein [Sorangium]AUX36220.1 uncharacterized protein SOCE836_084270 [Sorangium cellulosum]WCQ95522.1 hypothetical protein NQZ70_08299 [Sorangium sp. Soce836]
MHHRVLVGMGLAVSGLALASACGDTGEACDETVTCKGPAGAFCAGECVPLPVDLSRVHPKPVLLWEGSIDEEPPPCPPDASEGGLLLYGGLDPAPGCAPCACSQPACELPAGVTASSLYMCQDGAPETRTPFDAPAGWDGACVDTAPIPPEQVGSVAVAPATAVPCAPVEAIVPRSGSLGSPWKHHAKLCAGSFYEGACGDGSGEVCFPRFHKRPTPAFKRCVQVTAGADDEKLRCPNEYPKAHTWYLGHDDGVCSPCACTATEPSVCEALVSTYADAACGREIASVIVNEEGGCADPSAGFSLGSMRAEWVTNAPGTCEASGGEPVRDRTPVDRLTYCCIEEPITP